MSSDKFDFEDLKVYQKSLDYVDFVYDLIYGFPKIELYILNPQFLRAAHSIALNIAEGYGWSIPQFAKYINISRGSVKECIAITEIAFRRKYITDDKYTESRTRLTELSKMLSGLLNHVKKKM